MSKVYSFRLSDNNPREAQARGVIEAWAGEGYSLRQVMVEALISYKDEDISQGELSNVIEKLQYLIFSLDKKPKEQSSNDTLSNSFLVAVKQSAKSGFRAK